MQTTPLLLDSGRIAVPVGPGLVALTGGERIWWSAPPAGRHAQPRLAVQSALSAHEVRTTLSLGGGPHLYAAEGI
ncbi:hypothetical protein [Streptosporangium sp. NPDC051022]|uniref:hypothetical protein n=1 Tax=Streptosporangium sp. NPDC051022 TaxID=3155752 RepID=UPI0034163B8A